MPRILGILIRPQATWTEIRAAEVGWAKALFGYAAPLALIPSITWPLGRMLQGATDSVGAGVASTLLLSLICLVLMAGAFFALAPFFRSRRSWDRSMALACYASTPVFLCGAFLVVPLLVIAAVGGLFYGIGLCAVGLRVLLDCPDGEVETYLATASMVQVVGAMAVGALCGAIGAI